MNRIYILIIAALTLLMPCSTAMAQNAADKSWMFQDTIALPVTTMEEVLVTPDGSDAVTYILNNVATRAKANRKKLNYSATAHVDVIVRDADVLPKIMPKTLMFMAQLYLRTKGMWALTSYVLSRPSADATLQTHHTCTGGKVKYDKSIIVKAPEDMKKKVGRQLTEMCQFDPFEEIYGENTIVNAKFREKFNIKFMGSIEEDGKIIFVLRAERKHGALREVQTLHIIDGIWAIRRAEFSSRIFRSYRECRDIGQGIYMPWRKVDNPVQIDLDTAISKAEKMLASKDKVKNMERKTLERAKKVASGDRKYTPMMKMGYEITYSK